LPETASTRNPVDFAGGGEDSRAIFEHAVRIVLESGEVDAALVTGYFGGYSEISEEFRTEEVAVARGMARAALDAGRPLVVQSMYPSAPSIVALREAGVPAYREIEAAAAALSRLAELGLAPASGVPELPEPAAETVEASGGGYFEARELLAAAGIRFATARRVEWLDQARVAAAEIGYPVALKALGLLHKSDAGGVVLGIETEEELARSFADLTTR
jgi:acyl-CoA synthetase (NDP forming)